MAKAYWYDDNRFMCLSYDRVCSHCKNETKNVLESSNYHKEPRVYTSEYSYCPYCGSEMIILPDRIKVTEEMEKELMNSDDKLDVIDRMLDALKIDYIESFVINDTIVFLDKQLSDVWSEKKLYEFVIYDCLKFDENNNLVEGFYVKENLLKEFLVIAACCNVFPNKGKE